MIRTVPRTLLGLMAVILTAVAAWYVGDDNDSQRNALESSARSATRDAAGVGRRRARAPVDAELLPTTCASSDESSRHRDCLIGRVTNDRGEPIGGARVDVIAIDPGVGVPSGRTTDAAGIVRFEGLSSTPSRLSVTAEGFSRFVSRVAFSGEEIHIVLNPTSMIRGRVLGPEGRPISDAEVRASVYSSGHYHESECRSAADGSFVVAEPLDRRCDQVSPDGDSTRRIEVRKPGYAPTVLNDHGIVQGELIVRLAAGAELRGTVRRPGGDAAAVRATLTFVANDRRVWLFDPITGATLLDERCDRSRSSVATGPDGTFVIADIAAGGSFDGNTRRVDASGTMIGTLICSSEGSATMARSVYAHEIARPIEIIVDESVEVRGVVVGADGAPVKNARVFSTDNAITGIYGKRLPGLAETTTNDDGQFVLERIPRDRPGKLRVVDEAGTRSIDVVLSHDAVVGSQIDVGVLKLPGHPIGFLACRDFEGRPITTARVASPFWSPVVAFESVAGSDGVIDVFSRTERSATEAIKVAIRAPGYVTTTIDFGPGSAEATTVRMARSVVVEGQVFGVGAPLSRVFMVENARTVEEAVDAITSDTALGAILAETTSDRNGLFRLSVPEVESAALIAVPDGSGKIVATECGFDRFSSSKTRYDISLPTAPSRVTLNLVALEPDGIPIAEAAARISRTGRTTEFRRASLGGLMAVVEPGHVYRLVIDAPGHERIEEDFSVTALQSAIEIKRTLERCGGAQGRIIEARRHGVTEVILCHAATGSRRRSRIASDGSFAVGDLPSGRYFVSAMIADEEDDLAPETALLPHAIVVASGSTSKGEFRIVPGGSLRVRLSAQLNHDSTTRVPSSIFLQSLGSTESTEISAESTISLPKGTYLVHVNRADGTTESHSVDVGGESTCVVVR